MLLLPDYLVTEITQDLLGYTVMCMKAKLNSAGEMLEKNMYRFYFYLYYVNMHVVIIAKNTSIGFSSLPGELETQSSGLSFYVLPHKI